MAFPQARKMLLSARLANEFHTGFVDIALALRGVDVYRRCLRGRHQQAPVPFYDEHRGKFVLGLPAVAQAVQEFQERKR